MERDIRVSPKIVENFAKEIDPSLFYAVSTRQAVIYCEVHNPEDKDPYPIAEEIAKRTGTQLVCYKRGDITSQVSFSQGKIEDPQLAKRRVLTEIFERFGTPRSMSFKDPDYNEKDIRELKEEIEKQLLHRIHLSVPTTEELKRSICWF